MVVIRARDVLSLDPQGQDFWQLEVKRILSISFRRLSPKRTFTKILANVTLQVARAILDYAIAVLST